MANVKTINTSELLDNDALVVVIDDVSHPRIEPTVKDMLHTLKDLEDLGKASSMADELDVVIRIVMRSFPTMTREMVEGYPIVVLNEVFAIARDGEIAKQETDEQGKS
ncbi:hypothetical protein [Paracoccus litorisediminis]|uniref:Uncharacterized protein n=1 Tax=Paracoccus litorisediminis TaxID=2006130 RepID=A0A844HLP9_9RHOB|nr:hypothetical protein [Paracoccus litorisediminis]MTH61203.1 hypothetical protein [Paracoccus litorisediminis]